MILVGVKVPKTAPPFDSHWRPHPQRNFRKTGDVKQLKDPKASTPRDKIKFECGAAREDIFALPPRVQHFCSSSHRKPARLSAIPMDFLAHHFSADFQPA